jgi:hypothetical protein
VTFEQCQHHLLKGDIHYSHVTFQNVTFGLKCCLIASDIFTVQTSPILNPITMLKDILKMSLCKCHYINNDVFLAKNVTFQVSLFWLLFFLVVFMNEV